MRQGYAGTTASIISSTMPSITAAPKADITGALKTFADARYQAEKQQREREMYQKYLKDEEKNDQNLNDLSEALQSGNDADINSAYARLDPVAFMKNRMESMEEQRQFERQMEMLNRRATLDEELARIKAGGGGLVEQSVDENGNIISPVQAGLDTLKDIADRNTIGAWTRFRNATKTSTEQQEKDLGALSAAIGAIAPHAIFRLKNAGVSGVNTLGEFMTYVGLPENPTSTQIKGALPLIAQILGKSNPYGEIPSNEQQTQANYKSKYGLE